MGLVVTRRGQVLQTSAVPSPALRPLSLCSRLPVGSHHHLCAYEGLLMRQGALGRPPAAGHGG